MINLSNNIQDCPQEFLIFTEATWAKHKDNYSHNTQLFFKGKKEEFFVLTHNETLQFLIGIGDNAKDFEVKETAEKFSYQYKDQILSNATLLKSNLSTEATEAFIKGLCLGTYEFSKNKIHAVLDDNFKLIIPELSTAEITSIAVKTQALCKGQFTAMDWLNKPANHKKTEHITAFLKELSKHYGFKYKNYNHQESINKGLGAFIAVNQGSSQEAAFTIIEYNADLENAKTIGLVGKCILFDTGGISIKPSSNLHYMKSDMGGATAVIGTLIAAAELKLPVKIVAVLPITDNAVSSKSYLPSDVITAYNGKTIEIIDTDAEGRLTLADGLAYITKNHKTDVLIDLATLTGSSVRMFGNTCSAMFSNDIDLKNQLEISGNKTNQRVWNLPLWNIWNNELSSDVADYKNISLKPVGDCIIAAKFLEQFTNNHPKWAHLDIAGVAYDKMQYAKDKAATGYGVELLLDVIEKI